MLKKEYERILKESVDAGADPKEAADYITKGFKLPVDKKGDPIFDAEKKSPAVKKKK